MLDRNGDDVLELDIDDPMSFEQMLNRVVDEPTIHEWNDRLCTICEKPLINRPLATEGGLMSRWGCPLHGTRGVSRW